MIVLEGREEGDEEKDEEKDEERDEDRWLETKKEWAEEKYGRPKQTHCQLLFFAFVFVLKLLPFFPLHPALHLSSSLLHYTSILYSADCRVSAYLTILRRKEKEKGELA